MKNTQKNRWKLPIIIGGVFLAIIVVLSMAVLILNNRESRQLGLNNQNDYVFGELKTSIQYPQQSCHLQGGNGRILIDFHNKGLCSHKRTDACRDFWWQDANIPAGKYKVYLESYDGYGPSPGKNDGREHSSPQDQKYEQYYVEFYKGNAKVATSGTTPDLQDGIREARFSGIVNNELNIPQNTTKLLLKHKVPYPNKPNSLRAICMMLEPVPEPGQCGAIVLTNKLYNSAPAGKDLCVSGEPTRVTETVDSMGRVWSWRCKGINGGRDSEVCKVHGKPLPVCGDSKVNQEDEDCDRGQTENGKVCTAGYGETCTYCDSNCKEKTVVGPRCGDGDVNGEEECDRGTAENGQVPTVGYGETKEYCKSDCTVGTVVGGQCGNGTVEGDEKCDLGTANNGKVCVPEYGKTCTYCDDSCQEQTVTGGNCGNGTKEGDEKCDDGDDNGKIPTVAYGKTATYCKTDCTVGTVVGGQCGNGTREGDEECDDGNTTNGDGCSSTCQIEEEKREDEPDCNSSIGNYIWYDTNSNGIQEDIEEGIEGIKVCAFRGNKKYCDTTNKNGKYKIKDLCEGTYTVVVKDVGAMAQTFDPDGKKDNKTKVKLKNNDKHTKADFGYRGKAPSTGLATNIALLIGLSTLITIGILLVMRKKDMI